MFCKYCSKIGTIKETKKSSFQKNSLIKVEIAVGKDRNHAGINAVNEKMEKLGNPKFRFDFTSFEETVKEVNNSKIRKIS